MLIVITGKIATKGITWLPLTNKVHRWRPNAVDFKFTNGTTLKQPTLYCYHIILDIQKITKRISFETDVPVNLNLLGAFKYEKIQYKNKHQVNNNLAFIIIHVLSY